MNILQAMDDPELFGKFFKKKMFRTDTWGAWRAFLAALFALPMTEAQRLTYTKHTKRTDIPSSPFSEAYLICGRRSGKSVISAMVATYLACFVDYSPYCVPGEQLILPVICPDRKQAQTIMGYIKGMFQTSKTLESMVSRILTESIELRNGVKIEVATASFRTTRGFTCIGAILDEVAFLRSDESANPDEEIVQALLPGMSTIPNATLLALSSPYARRGLLYERHREFFGVAGAPALIWQADTRSMNPNVSRLTVETALLRDRASAASEYLAEFRSDLEAFLSLELIESRVARNVRELPYRSGVSYSAFVDPSGGVSDSFCLGIGHCDEDGVGVLDLLREVKPPFSPESVCGQFAEDLRYYHVSEVVGDAYGGEWPREQFEKRGISYRVCDQTRSQLYLELLPLLTSGQTRLLDLPGLVLQLSQLERKTGRGRDVIDHPSGSHDDMANVAAGCLVLATIGGEGGQLPLVTFLKKMAARVAAGLDFFESKPKPAPIVHPAGHAVPAQATSEDCPVCGLPSRLRVGSLGSPYRCVNDGTQWIGSTIVTVVPDPGQCCGSPLPIRISGFVRCANCGRQDDSSGGQRWAHNGVSRSDFQRGGYRRRAG